MAQPKALAARAMPALLRCAPQHTVLLPAAATLTLARPPRQQQPSRTGPSSGSAPSGARAFSATAAAAGKNVKHWVYPIPSRQDPAVPEYPYGERRLYKQSNTGLYGSASIRFGNVTTKGHKYLNGRYAVPHRRTWRPNVHYRRLYSEALKMFVRCRLTTRVLRTVDKCGGLDEYILGHKAQRLKDLGPWGWRLRWRLLRTRKVKIDFARMRRELGVPAAQAAAEAAVAAAEERAMAQAAAAAAAAAGLPPMVEGGEEEEAMIAETDRFLADEDGWVDIGPEEDGRTSPHAVVNPDGFMHEEKAQRPRV